jgi:hypothetical protein
MNLRILIEKVLSEACWKNYKQEGMKKKGKRMVPNCVSKKKKKGEFN